VPYIVTLTHVRYGRHRIDLGELKERLEVRIAARGAPRLARLLTHTNRLIALMDFQDSGRSVGDMKARMNAEFAFLLLDFEQVQSVMAGVSRRRTGAPKRPLLPGSKAKPRR
jgi:hypothetical protein